ncbi:MAG: glutamine amidotransferase [bacterium]
MFSLLQKFGIDTSGFNTWSLHFSGLEHWLTYLVLAGLAVAGLLWVRSSLGDLTGRGRRVFLLLLQVAAVLALAFLLLQPAIRLAKTAKLAERVVVLIDTSESMTLPAGEKQTRRESALHFLRSEKDFFHELEEEFSVSWLGFDEAVARFDGLPEKGLPAKGPATDILSALGEAARSEEGTPLAGVALISDGTDTKNASMLRGSPEKVKGLLQDFPAPVNTVAAGDTSVIKDLAIMDVVHDDYGFVHNPFEVSVSIRARGDLSRKVPVSVKQGGRVLTSETIELGPANSDVEVSLRFTPRQVGEFMFTVEVPEVPGEVTTSNNTFRFPLKVLRDKTRILYIVGNPSWDERFLRETLKKNPSVDLVSFYILRQHWDDYQARQEEVSLIPFPTHELFTKELDTFDMVIWQNFRGPPYMFHNYPTYMSNLNRFVRERGGAFLMIGGPRGFFGQGRLDPKLRDILPVEPVNSIPNYTEDKFKAALTEAGMRHPIMDVGDSGEEAAEVWPRLPALSAFNRVRRAVPGALVLARHPYEKGAKENVPLIAVREVGAGRVMTVMTDCSWQWNLLAAGEGKSNKPYQRFWENSVRWLLQDPAMKLLSLNADKGKVEPGEEVKFVLEVLDETYEPTDKADVSIEVVKEPEGSELQLPEPQHFAKGKYRFTVTPEKAGGYRVRAQASLQERSLGQDDEIIEVAKRSEEFEDVMPHPKLLKAISDTTGGAAVQTSGSADDFVFNRRDVEQVTGIKDVPLWDNWPVFVLVFGLLVAGWYFRRKWGLR